MVSDALQVYHNTASILSGIVEDDNQCEDPFTRLTEDIEKVEQLKFHGQVLTTNLLRDNSVEYSVLLVKLRHS